ncbi:MAG: hypothetical protein FK731_06305 [Asgard group archaeon]|nr:hypothetical protein [Asgard group archaeon]
MNDENLSKKIGFLEESPGNRSSKRLFAGWFVILATVGFVAALFFPITDSVVRLTEFAMGSAVALGVGGKGVELLPKIFHRDR